MLENYRYASLHNHSEYSNITLIDALNRISEMVDHSIKMGLAGMALTDHESLSGTVKYLQYYNSLSDEKKAAFKPIIGDEIYLVDEVKQQKMYHFLLLAKNLTGFEQLKQISSQAWANSYAMGKITRRPITKVELKNIIGDNKGHLVATTACLGGEFPTYVNQLLELEAMEAPIEEINVVKQNIVDFIKWCVDVFGKENFFIEIQPSTQRDQIIFNEKAKQLAKVFGLEMVVTTDSHYLTKDDQAVHTAFLNSKDETRDVAQYYRSAHFMDAQEMYDHRSIKNFFTEEEFKHILDNTVRIADMCEVYDIAKQQEVPYVDRTPELAELKKKYPNGLNLEWDKYPSLKKIIESDDETNHYWLYRIYDFLLKRDLINHEYVSRIDLEAEELHAISERLNTNLFSYYVTMTKIQDIAWNDANAIIGVGRGSVTGFLSAWALEIQGIDSIKYGLPHWRHISKERPELPDIDFDTPSSRRKNLLLATKNYFGDDKVLTIATFKTEGPKSAIATAGKGYRSDAYPYGLSNDETAYLSSMIKYERGFAWSIRDTYYGNPEKEREPSREFKKQMDLYPGLLEIALRIEGIISGRSSHASGVYIYNKSFVNYNAMMKAPNGVPTTQFDMADSDYQGGLKFDYLTVTGLDIIQTTLDLLTEEGYIKQHPTLKETYNAVLNPEKIIDGDQLWKHAYERQMLSVFQFDTAVGGDAIAKVKPHSLEEAAHVNSLMRLMATDRGALAPADKFVLFKNNIDLWYDEMREAGLNQDEVAIMEKHFKNVYGVAATQEELMIIAMDEKVSNFDLTEANKLRKAVAKKKADVMEQVKTLFYEKGRAQGTRDVMLDYVWNYVAMPQAGYSFSKLHTTAYTMIALQELTLFHNFPEVFWNTAVLIVNSASVEEVIDPAFVEVQYDEEGNVIEEKSKVETVDYGKIAKSIGEIRSAGITVSPPHINTAEKRFEADVENNRILYSLKGLTNVGDNEIEEILEKRPFTSFKDFLARTSLKKPAVVSLIKSGAFDELEGRDRFDIMVEYIESICEPKKRLTMQNFKGLIAHNLVPESMRDIKSLFEFNRYIKQKEFARGADLFIDERAERFLNAKFPNFFARALKINAKGEQVVSAAEWKKVYDNGMEKAKEWVKKEQASLLKQYNLILFNDMWDKYCEGDLAKWEMDSMCYYSGEHELAHVDMAKYGISHFYALPESPKIESFFVPSPGKSIPIYKIDKIIGTCIDKDAMKNTFTILTPDGAVVTIRLNNEHFAYYNKQLSVFDPLEGKKKVMEKSWFSRGNKLMIVGFRRDQNFTPKRYKNTVEQHRIYLINGVEDNGELSLASSRWGEES